MKPYHTSFMRVAAFMMLLCSLSIFAAQKANANCDYFTISTQDSAWQFSANVGSSQSRTIYVTNNSDSTLVLDANIPSPSLFGLNHTQFTIAAHDTVGVVITFKPPTGTANGTTGTTIHFTRHGTDCHQNLGLYGTTTGNNSNGGHDKVVTINPSPVNFPPLAAGKDTCMGMYLMNYTGETVKIETLSFLHGNTNFRINPAFTGGAMDSGKYFVFSVCCTGDANHTEFSDTLVATVEYGGAAHTLYALIIGHTASDNHNSGSGDILVADPHTYSFGAVQGGTTACKDFIVTNKSNSPVVITGWHRCDGNFFSVSPAFTTSDTLPAHASKTFTICYSPTGNDSVNQNCSLSINYLRTDTSGDAKTLTITFFGWNPGSNSNHEPCLRTESGDNYHDAIVVGTTANHTLHLINTSSSDITVNSATITGPDAGVFAIVTSLPITVPANSTSTTLIYSFSPTSNSKSECNAMVTLALSGDNIKCQSIDGHLIGWVAHSTNAVDSVVRPIFPNEKRTLVVEGTSSINTRTFYFTNNLNVDCTVNSVKMAIGTYFTVTSTTPSPVPFVLHPGDNLQVVVTYTATDNLVHHDSLLIDANHSLLAQGFDIQGLQVAAGVANALPEGVAINVSPNPASSNLTVAMAGIKSASIEVIDLLGNTVTTAKSSTMWKWNATNAAAGSYIVRISGESTNGEQFVASKRIIISK